MFVGVRLRRYSHCGCTAADGRTVMNFSLDHIGIVSRDVVALRDAYHDLGFSPTTPDELQRVATNGERLSLGQASCHAVLQRGYIELSGVSSTDPNHHLATYLARGPGLHILALGTDDIDAAHRHCRSVSNGCSEINRAARDIRYGSRHGAAQFDWFMLAPAAAPEGLICVVRNRSPELVYQPEVMYHPNGALALCGIVVACTDPELAARRYASLLGAKPLAVGADLQFALLGGTLILRDSRRAQRLHGFATDAGADRLVAFEVETPDLACTSAVLEAAQLPHSRADDSIIVPRTNVTAASVVFRATS